MKNNSTAVVNLQKRNNKVENKKTEVIKFVASTNNTQYNMSIEYYPKTRTVSKFSLGFSLKETHINDNVRRNKAQLKTSHKDMSAFSIFYNFVNFNRLDLTSLEYDSSKKITLYKSIKTYFYGTNKTDTVRVNIKVNKATEIYLLLDNIYRQIVENDEAITILKNNRKKYPDDENLKEVLNKHISSKSVYKKEFIDIVKNMLKRWF